MPPYTALIELVAPEKKRSGAPKTFGQGIQVLIMEDFRGQVPPLEVVARRDEHDRAVVAAETGFGKDLLIADLPGKYGGK